MLEHGMGFAQSYDWAPDRMIGRTSPSTYNYWGSVAAMKLCSDRLSKHWVSEALRTRLHDSSGGTLLPKQMSIATTKTVYIIQFHLSNIKFANLKGHPCLTKMPLKYKLFILP
ncbi:MAG: hypothetical protein A2826_01080 [Candidatus Doudnabacteria bacterium RIFCSPHIGHO2_01_FULL_43_23]|uniref:Uncharacterized protein n=1 Tax=Candidatus Doudnabacteria bacterium RIFCSPHIGHO2_01_FULL_43_23 TaxID=1817822 RepID=A0A1F5NSU8_9BACT|nr:MAG: hypothetical protein A2826_01080 [Candidatus Doudnabacteria bacterium RIFCSPHIGHO2_01_FULL_43_23]